MRNSKTQAKYLAELIKNIDLAILNTNTPHEINQTSTNSKRFKGLLILNINQLNLFEK